MTKLKKLSKFSQIYLKEYVRYSTVNYIPARKRYKYQYFISIQMRDYVRMYLVPTLHISFDEENIKFLSFY